MWFKLVTHLTANDVSKSPCQLIGLITRWRLPFAVLSGILLALDTGNLALLSFLDLSAAFHGVDHDTLLQRLQMSYGLGGNATDWFASYLTGRTQYVRAMASRSAPLAVLFGVPQGSVLGPILFLVTLLTCCRL